MRVKSIYHTHKVDKVENIHAVKNMLDRHALSQAEEEQDNETVKSLQFCKLKRHKSVTLEEWIKRLRIAPIE